MTARETEAIITNSIQRKTDAMPNPVPPSTNLPYPLLVNAATGTAAPPVPPENFAAMPSDLAGADQRIAGSTHLGTDWSVDDANELALTGWGIIFASDADPAIQAQLKPLIDLREKQVQGQAPHKVFSGADGVQPGQTAAGWAQQHGVSLTAAVHPEQGVPYYLLIVGSPERISFEFQALLKMQWAVGRLYFDDIEDYGRYARAVVEYESDSFQPVQAKNAAVWVTRNYGDPATALLSGTIADDFLAPANQLGARNKFMLSAFVNQKATKAQLIEIMRGNVPGGPPAVIFTGSHGCEYDSRDPVNQRQKLGSLISQEWNPDSPVDASCQICADDIPADAKLQGTMGFLFACYSGGCPAQNSYYFNADGSPINFAPAPFVARLPQALLSHGMLAVIAHIDLAFPSAFIDVAGTPQPQAVRTPLEWLMRGRRTGYAADSLSVLWSSTSSQLALEQAKAAPLAAAGTNAPGASKVLAPSPRIVQMTIARDDARNYIVLGDPATQLRIDKLK
jgi:hypothetical protein